MNTFYFLSDESMHQEHQVCAFSGCKRLAQQSQVIIPVFDEDVMEVTNLENIYHACCSRKHEMFFKWRANHCLCLCCGISQDVSGSDIPWCCGKSECKNAILSKIAFNHNLRYVICMANCVAL